MSQLFSRLQRQGIEFTVRVSFLEIYNEVLTDLLGADSVENSRLKIYEDNIRVRNALPSSVTDSATVATFKSHLKTYLFARSLS